MKKKSKVILWLSLLAMVILLTIAYMVTWLYFRDKFYPGTYVNGIYCTGKTTEEINEELNGLFMEQQFAGNEVFFLQDNVGRQYEIELSEIQFQIDFSAPLERLKQEQNPLVWITGLWKGGENEVFPAIQFSEEQLKEAIAQCGIQNHNIHTESPEASLVEIRKAAGYTLYDGRKQVLDISMVAEKAALDLREAIFGIDVSQCYTDLPYTEDMQETLSLWEKVDAFQKCGIVYDMGDTKVLLNSEIVSGFIATDENGDFLLDAENNLMLDEEAVAAFIDTLCEEYDTYKSTREFMSTRGDLITIEGGTYGNVLDREAEIAYLRSAILNGEGGIHVPAYEKEAYCKGKNDIGDTYIEVDMTEQKLYFYEKGTLVTETDIVTGNMRRGWDTPTGVNYIYNLQRNRTLRGSNYTAFVKYWVPVVGNIGLHDASWRKEFGGDIYERNGSHGCINVPSEVMAEMYEHLEIGVPVVMFY